MSLETEIQSSIKKIVTDGYDMSVGELMSMYKDNELIINPKYQRYFRWEISQKTKFIESLLLGIPIPPIFVFTTEGRKWELVDGLQRISTILEFAGILKDSEDAQGQSLKPPSMLEGTQLLPSLSGKKWEPTDEDSDDGLTVSQQIGVKRVRIRVEILKQESDPLAKYELFQRLNTGGSFLSFQEVRSCILVMINEPFFDRLDELSNSPQFTRTLDLTQRAEQRQQSLEMVLRFFSFRNHPYHTGLDVHEYLDKASAAMASDTSFDLDAETAIFRQTFELLDSTLGSDTFKKWDGNRFTGPFLLSAFEVIAVGVSNYIDALNSMPNTANFVIDRVKALWTNADFRNNARAGVRGTTRLANNLPLAHTFFKP